MRLPIARDALVLEVGSGDSPCPRSDVLLDLTLENHERVGGHTVVDRPFVLGTVERLPFRDKAFDYVIAFHVLEHTADPVALLGELQRVARGGYIETPSFWWERMTPLTMHRLEVGLEQVDGGTRLVINQKTEPSPDAELHGQFMSGFEAQGQCAPFAAGCIGDALLLERHDSLPPGESSVPDRMEGAAGNHEGGPRRSPAGRPQADQVGRAEDAPIQADRHHGAPSVPRLRVGRTRRRPDGEPQLELCQLRPELLVENGIPTCTPLDGPSGEPCYNGSFLKGVSS